MKITTDAHIKRLINTEVFDATYKLRKELYGTLDSRNRADQLRRDQDNAETAKLVETSSDTLKQYVRDTLVEHSVAETVESPSASTPELAAAFNRGYEAGRARYADSPQLYRSNDELAHKAVLALVQKRGYADGHAAALTKVIELLGNNPRYMSHATLKRAVEGLAL